MVQAVVCLHSGQQKTGTTGTLLEMTPNSGIPLDRIESFGFNQLQGFLGNVVYSGMSCVFGECYTMEPHDAANSLPSHTHTLVG